jgi:hypothetical protein
MAQIFMICTDFSRFFICANHKKLRHLRAIFTQNYAERSINPQHSDYKQFRVVNFCEVDLCNCLIIN